MIITITTTTFEEQQRVMAFMESIVSTDAKIIREALQMSAQSITTETMPLMKIAEDYCKLFKIDLAEIRGSRKSREINEQRQLLMYIMKKFGYTATAIGKFLNKRNHATVLHGIKTIQGLMDVKPSYQEHVSTIFKALLVK